MNGYFNLSDIDANQFKIILLTIVRLFLLVRHKCLFYVLVIVHFTGMSVQFTINIQWEILKNFLYTD
ncbi:Uncharacterised protein [Salmonella enterica subsp. enterica]|nr:Uncharacterised protein [Salmonella enterica subsp. enterica] [Salmonella enterica subsp. enterica serovar Sundsvall]